MLGLHVRAWLGLFFLAAVMGLLVFVAAGTVRYWQGWVFLAVFFAAGSVGTFYLAAHDPALLERRLRSGPMAEKSPTQRAVMVLLSIGFAGLLVVPALDHRFGWSNVPLAAVVAADVLIAIGFYLTGLVYRENSYAAATVEIAAGQTVISTGPYAYVRHPQYAGALVYLAAMPVALGSYWGLLVFALMVPVLIWRLTDEEKLLARDLPGYADYQRRVRWRLIPGIF